MMVGALERAEVRLLACYWRIGEIKPTFYRSAIWSSGGGRRVARSSRDQMNMRVKYFLSGDFTNIRAKVKSFHVWIFPENI